MALGTARSFMNPTAAITHFHLREGEVFADFGTGAGQYIPELSKAVGTTGRVYACEIQKGLVERITELVQQQRLGNVHPIWCDLEVLQGTKLRDGLLDGGMLLNTLFQLENKGVALEEIARVIRKGGKLFVIDWADSFGGIGPHPSHVIKEDATKTLVEGHGFLFERSFPVADHHYGLAFRRT
jgi:ubiquinone/menaquinone biosynthesis C-methylase UbiE